MRTPRSARRISGLAVEKGMVSNGQVISRIGRRFRSSLNRDSCGSVRIGDRALWTCRDTGRYDSGGNPVNPLWSSSAAWTNFGADGTPQLTMYSNRDETPYYTYAQDQCPGSTVGDCGDGTRYALWPDSPPIIASTNANTVIGYTWVRNGHIAGLDPVQGEENPSTTLYKLEFNTDNGDRNALPAATRVNENWWSINSIPFGAFGSVVKDGTTYLFGQTSDRSICLAKVPTGSIENLSEYR